MVVMTLLNGRIAKRSWSLRANQRSIIVTFIMSNYDGIYCLL